MASRWRNALAIAPYAGYKGYNLRRERFMRLSRMYMLLGAVAAIGGVAHTLATKVEVTLSVRTVGELVGSIAAIFVIPCSRHDPKILWVDDAKICR